MRRFFEVMDGARDQRVFVHCAANYRVSSFVALYGEARFGWSPDQGDAHIRRIWEPNETWVRFIADARRRVDGVSGAGRMPRVCVFSGSSSGVRPEYRRAAKRSETSWRRGASGWSTAARGSGSWVLSPTPRSPAAAR